MVKSKKYFIYQDSRERQPWEFSTGGDCLGFEIKALKTGDYTLRGFEDLFVIERKLSLMEWANNIQEARFERELERLEDFKHPFLIFEFNLEQLKKWPWGSLPKHVACKIKIPQQLLLKKINEFEVKYKTKFVFGGKHAQEYAESLFKRIMEVYG